MFNNTIVTIKFIVELVLFEKGAIVKLPRFLLIDFNSFFDFGYFAFIIDDFESGVADQYDFSEKLIVVGSNFLFESADFHAAL